MLPPMEHGYFRLNAMFVSDMYWILILKGYFSNTYPILCKLSYFSELSKPCESFVDVDAIAWNMILR